MAGVDPALHFKIFWANGAGCDVQDLFVLSNVS